MKKILWFVLPFILFPAILLNSETIDLNDPFENQVFPVQNIPSELSGPSREYPNTNSDGIFSPFSSTLICGCNPLETDNYLYVEVKNLEGSVGTVTINGIYTRGIFGYIRWWYMYYTGNNVIKPGESLDGIFLSRVLISFLCFRRIYQLQVVMLMLSLILPVTIMDPR